MIIPNEKGEVVRLDMLVDLDTSGRAVASHWVVEALPMTTA